MFNFWNPINIPVDKNLIKTRNTTENNMTTTRNEACYTVGFADGLTNLKLEVNGNSMTLLLGTDEVHRLVRLLNASLDTAVTHNTKEILKG